LPKVVLVEPEIPPNTGSIARLCAGIKIELHLVGPLGFSLEDRYLRRAGLDYWPHVDLHLHDDWAAFMRAHGGERSNFWLLSKKSSRPYTTVEYKDEDWLIFGKETKGLSPEIVAGFPGRCLRIPIIGQIRSYNLSNAVSIVLFEALRQCRPEHFRSEEEK